jgi:hypothetical protein
MVASSCPVPLFRQLDRDALAAACGGWARLGLPSTPNPSCSELQGLKDVDDEIVSHNVFSKWEFGRRSREVADQMQQQGCPIAPNKYKPDAR